MPLSSDRDPAFDARWAAWIARGAAHDRAVRRRMTIAMPFVAIIVVVLFYFFVAR